jgi:phage host-nuclease inhibitor protein Gam
MGMSPSEKAKSMRMIRELAEGQAEMDKKQDAEIAELKKEIAGLKKAIKALADKPKKVEKTGE